MAQTLEARVWHVRAQRGEREIDLLVEGRGGRLVGIEVKLPASVSDKDVRHLLWLRDQLGEQIRDLVVITTGPTAYRRPDRVAMVPPGPPGAVRSRQFAVLNDRAQVGL
ncbi:MAG: hypothetical protein Q4D79_03195 [Propionibacteriaceae bacterium]|nr:hypothetical protein [Propionibacteriaceae bacterium]